MSEWLSKKTSFNKVLKKKSCQSKWKRSLDAFAFPMKQRTPSTEHLARVTAGFQKRNSTGNHCGLPWNSARTLSCFCVFPIWFHIIFLYIYCMWCVWVFCLHVHVCTAWVQGPWRPGEGIESPRTGITDTVTIMWVQRTEPLSSERALSALNAESSLQSLFHIVHVCLLKCQLLPPWGLLPLLILLPCPWSLVR